VSSRRASGAAAELRSAARIGDFREILLPKWHTAAWPPGEAVDDNVVHDHDAVRRGLKIASWLRQQEVQLFSAPFECKDAGMSHPALLQQCLVEPATNVPSMLGWLHQGNEATSKSLIPHGVFGRLKQGTGLFGAG
jgi:hypothetical protein